MKHLQNIIVVLLVVLALPSIPWLLSAFPPMAVDVDDSFVGWGVWFDNLIVVAGLFTSAYLAYTQARYWFLVILLMCGYVAFLTTLPFIQRLLDGNFLEFIKIIWMEAQSSGGTKGFYLIWNLIVLPIFPIVIIPLAVWSWLKKHKTEFDELQFNK